MCCPISVIQTYVELSSSSLPLSLSQQFELCCLCCVSLVAAIFRSIKYDKFSHLFASKNLFIIQVELWQRTARAHKKKRERGGERGERKGGRQHKSSSSCVREKTTTHSAQLGDWPHFNAFFIVWACVGFVLLLLWVTRRLGLLHTLCPYTPSSLVAWLPLSCSALCFAYFKAKLTRCHQSIRMFSSFFTHFPWEWGNFLLILRSIFAAAFPFALIYDILMSNRMWIVNGRRRGRSRRRSRQGERDQERRRQ